jgi:hypothetical protein
MLGTDIASPVPFSVPFLKDKNDVWPSTQEADRG